MIFLELLGRFERGSNVLIWVCLELSGFFGGRRRAQSVLEVLCSPQSWCQFTNMLGDAGCEQLTNSTHHELRRLLCPLGMFFAHPQNLPAGGPPGWGLHAQDQKCQSGPGYAVNNQAKCEADAVSAGALFYSFRHLGGNDNSMSCIITSDGGCSNPVSTPANPWKIYKDLNGQSSLQTM